MQKPFFQDDSSAETQQITALVQENAMLRTRLAELEVCQPRLELEQVCAILTAKVTKYRRRRTGERKTTRQQEEVKQFKDIREQERMALERVEELQKTNEALQRTIARLATNPELDAYLGHVLIEAAEQAGACTNALFVYDQISHSLTMRAIVCDGEITDIHIDPRLEIFRESIPADISPAWQIMSEELNLFLHEVNSSASEAWQHTLPWHMQMGHESVLCVPLRIGDRAIGFMGLCFRERAKIASEKGDLARALANQATMALELTRLADEAKQAAIFEERNRLAREIHDTLAQAFTGIAVQLELAKFLNQQNSAELTATLDRIGELAQTGLAEARRSVWTLYSAIDDYADLAQQLSDCLTQMTVGTSLQTKIVIHGEPYSLPAFIGKNLLRIGQEAITNALKYAQATHLLIELTYVPEGLSLCVSDNGCGFDTQATRDGFGLISMSERADRIGGQLTITTQPGQGTKIYVQVTTALS